MFFATIIIAGLNGLVLLPVVLSLIGPHAVPLHLDEAATGNAIGSQRSALSRLVDSKTASRQNGPNRGTGKGASPSSAQKKERLASSGTNMVDLDDESPHSPTGSSANGTDSSQKYTVSEV